MLASIFLASCATNKLLYKPYQLSLPKGFQRLSRAEADSVLKTFAGSFKNATFYDFYLKDSIVIGLFENKNKNLEYGIVQQTMSSHDIYIREATLLADNEDKYDGYQIMKNENYELIIRNFHSSSNNNIRYYKAFLIQRGDEVLKGLMVYSKADSIAGNVILNRVIESIKIIP